MKHFTSSMVTTAALWCHVVSYATLVLAHQHEPTQAFAYGMALLGVLLHLELTLLQKEER